MRNCLPLESWVPNYNGTPLLIVGPCSAESYEQVHEIASELIKRKKIHFFRAGVWKPRTRPGQFEGNGEEALVWLSKLRKELKIPICIEVANPKQVELAMKYEADSVWLGARTTVNPFLVQEIADSLKSTDVPVFVKNPVSPDLNLWLGAIERILNVGIKKVAAIHRGFPSLDDAKYRNSPLWSIPLELKSIFPQIPLICDPSHISGRRDLIESVSQKAMDLSYDGLMIEVHNNPDIALSDKDQQITPEVYERIISSLVIRTQSTTDSNAKEKLNELRASIDRIDRQLLEILVARLSIVKNIGTLKRSNNMAFVQMSRWNDLLQDRLATSEKMGLNEQFIKELFQLVHAESIKVQSGIE